MKIFILIVCIVAFKILKARYIENHMKGFDKDLQEYYEAQ